MKTRAKPRKIVVDGDTYSWVVASNSRYDLLGREASRQVFIRPITYRGRKLEAYLGEPQRVIDQWNWEGSEEFPVAVRPSHVEEFIKTNKNKF